MTQPLPLTIPCQLTTGRVPVRQADLVAKALRDELTWSQVKAALPTHVWVALCEALVMGLREVRHG